MPAGAGRRGRRRSSSSSTAPRASPRTTSSCSGRARCAGLFVAAGFCAHGIAGAGGVGRVMAEWILDGEPSFDTWKMDIRRFGAALPEPGPTPCARAVEVYSTYYDIHYPERGAPGRSPAAPLAGVRRACRSWAACSARRADGSARTGSPRTRRWRADRSNRPRGWAGEHWSPAIDGEALACRDTVVLFDETSFSKMEVVGSGAATFLNRVCANEIDRPVGGGHLHPTVQRARRHRVRPDRHPAGRGPLPARHGHGLRQPRPGLDPQAATSCPEGADVAASAGTSPPHLRASASGDRRPGTCSSR